MTAPRPDISLDDIRREIDSIDDAILDLVVKRFAATGRVAAAKASDGSIAVSPFRPAREASLLRRLAARGEGQISPQLLVRLWRVILSFSTQAQAAVTIHTGPEDCGEGDFRIRLAEHFCGMEVLRHGSIPEALGTLSGRMGDLAVLPASADWAGHYMSMNKRTPRVIGRLAHGAGSTPILIFGHADTQPTGDDETLLVTRKALTDNLPADRRWTHARHESTILALSGFLHPDHPAIASILSADPDACIAGRYPTPIEIKS